MTLDDAFDRLASERPVTSSLFVFHYGPAVGRQEGDYSTLAHSLEEASGNLRHADVGADPGGYLVVDAFVEMAKDQDGAAVPVVHVQVVAYSEMTAQAFAEIAASN